MSSLEKFITEKEAEFENRFMLINGRVACHNSEVKRFLSDALHQYDTLKREEVEGELPEYGCNCEPQSHCCFTLKKVGKWVEYKDLSKDEQTTTAKQLGGLLKILSYKDAWKQMWSEISAEDRNFFKTLLHFNPEIFEKITGIKVEDEVSLKGKTVSVELDGDSGIVLSGTGNATIKITSPLPIEENSWEEDYWNKFNNKIGRCFECCEAEDLLNDILYFIRTQKELSYKQGEKDMEIECATRQIALADIVKSNSRTSTIKEMADKIQKIWGEMYFSSVHNETEHYIKINPEDFKKLDFTINNLDTLE